MSAIWNPNQHSAEPGQICRREVRTGRLRVAAWILVDQRQHGRSHECVGSRLSHCTMMSWWQLKSQTDHGHKVDQSPTSSWVIHRDIPEILIHTTVTYKSPFRQVSGSDKDLIVFRGSCAPSPKGSTMTVLKAKAMATIIKRRATIPRDNISHFPSPLDKVRWCISRYQDART